VSGERPVAKSPGTSPRPCGFPLGKLAGEDSRLNPGPTPRSRRRRRSCVAAGTSFGDVPLPANGSHSLIGLKRQAPACALTDGAPGVLPFAVLLLLTGGSVARFRAAGPTCRLPERPPRSVLDRGIGRHLPKFRRADICPTRVETVDPGRSGRLLGFGPVSNPCPPFPGRADTALGFRPLSGIGLIVSQRSRLGTLESFHKPSTSGDFFQAPIRWFGAWAKSIWSAQTADAGQIDLAGSDSVLMRSVPSCSQQIRACRDRLPV
jgi:hypothetical protein